MNLLLLPVVTLLGYIPLICYADLKWREIPHTWWLPIIAVNTPVMVYLYWNGTYPVYAALISLIMGGIFWVMATRDLIQGADLIWLWIISAFFIINPFPYPHGFEQPIFYIYLLVTMLITSLILLILNIRKGYRDGIVQMMSRWEPRGVPLVLPISAALVLTVAIG